MKKKLYIHIGSHKTGTTSIQKSLFENASLLKEHNLVYFSRNPDGSQDFHHNLNKWFYGYSKKHNAEKLAKKLAGFSENVIISAEALSFVFFKDELLQLKKNLDKFFDEIKIIAYLRRQDQQLISHYNQSTKFYETPENVFFGTSSLALPKYQKHFRHYFDYHQKLSMWSNVFGEKNIVIRIFDKKTLFNGDAVSDFFNTLNIKYLDNTVHVNESSNFEKAKIGLLMNQAGVNNRLLRNIISKNLNSNNKFLPCREEAEKFYALYHDSNIKLNKMFDISDNETIFNEDFSMYPEEGNQLWTEDTANEAIGQMIESLNETYGSIDYNIIFQAALQLEKSNFDLSYQIMQMLYKILPQDPNIQNKWKNYIALMKSTKGRENNIPNKAASIGIFIISWENQHVNAKAIANEIMKFEKNVSIVYSDPDPNLSLETECKLIKRPNDLFWGDKFSACIKACDADIMLCIHADCSTDNWKKLIKNCQKAYTEIPKLSVWAPLIHGTGFPLTITNIMPIKDTPLHIVANTDGMIFSLDRHSINRMKKVDYSSNIYGWGISPLFCAHAFVTNRLVVVDKSVVVNHPMGSGYDRTEAYSQLNHFRHQFTTDEMIQNHLLSTYISSNRLKVKKSNQTEEHK